PGSAGKPLVELNDPQLLTQAVESRLNSKRPEIEKAVKAYLGKGDLLARGVTLYSLNFRLGKPSVRLVSANSFEATISGNYLYFRSTQPTSLGKWADPAFEAHFDVRFRCTLSLPTATHFKIEAIKAEVAIPSLTIKGRNVVGKVATFAANLVKAFEEARHGREHVRKVLDNLLRHDVTSAI